MSHVTHMNESWYVHMNESCRRDVDGVVEGVCV